MNWAYLISNLLRRQFPDQIDHFLKPSDSISIQDRMLWKHYQLFGQL